LNPELHVRTVA